MAHGLEAKWDKRLRDLSAAEAELERRERQRRRMLSEEEKKKILSREQAHFDFRELLREPA